MTGRALTLPWWLGGEGVKTTENKISLDKEYIELQIRIHTIPKCETKSVVEPITLS
jgi:hypothetical protein